MNLGYNSTKGLLLSEELKIIQPKNKNSLQPIFEALMNSFEAIENLKQGNITITFNITKDLFTQKNGKSETKKYYFKNIKISDNGIGFNENEFNRFYTLRDNSKNMNNKGTGRIQYLHCFDKTHFSSIYADNKSSTKYKHCEFTLSKTPSFIASNSIIYVEKDEETDSKNNGTEITFTEPFNEKDTDFYVHLTPDEIKELIIKHYLNYFCENRAILPTIKIVKKMNDEIISSVFITKDDIPVPVHFETVQIKYSSLEKNKVVPISRFEDFFVSIFIIDEGKLPLNNIVLTSKGAETKKYSIDCLLPNDKIDGNRYLVLVSGTYIDQKDSDTRGEIKILTSEQYAEMNKDALNPEEIVLLDSILKDANKQVRLLCPEIEAKYQTKQNDLQELKKMFLLDDHSIDESNIGINDSDEIVLRKVYQANAKIAAKKDAKLKDLLREAEKINPKNTESYQQEITSLAKEYVKAIPLQNRNELAQYIARRRILLTFIDKVMEKHKSQQTKAKIAEDILHNLIFQQRSNDTENSDLWFINEEYIYFRGYSDIELSSIEIGGDKIFKDDFSKEEKRYLNSLGEKRLLKRPDVLLFPAESKCIIIEFKALDVNVSDHLSQISKYASLIANYTKKKYGFDTFYGYFIGEGIEPNDIFSSGTGDWIRAEHFDYLFRPFQNIYDAKKAGRTIASLYTEVIKYSTLLERAKIRNKVFIDKLEKGKQETTEQLDAFLETETENDIEDNSREHHAT